MTDFGWTRHLAWEKDGDGIWEVDFLSKRPALPPGSDGGIEAFRRDYKAGEAVRTKAAAEQEPTP